MHLSAQEERDALKARLQEMSAIHAQLSKENQKEHKKGISDIRLANSRLADMEEEMTTVIRKLEGVMMGLQSKVRIRDGENTRLTMQIKLLQAQADSYTRQLAEAQALSKGPSKSKQELELLQDQLKSAVDVRAGAVAQSEVLCNDLRLLQIELSQMIQTNELVAEDKHAEQQKVAQEEYHEMKQRLAEAKRECAAWYARYVFRACSACTRNIVVAAGCCGKQACGPNRAYLRLKSNGSTSAGSRKLNKRR